MARFDAYSENLKLCQILLMSRKQTCQEFRLVEPLKPTAISVRNAALLSNEPITCLIFLLCLLLESGSYVVHRTLLCLRRSYGLVGRVCNTWTCNSSYNRESEVWSYIHLQQRHATLATFQIFRFSCTVSLHLCTTLVASAARYSTSVMWMQCAGAERLRSTIQPEMWGLNGNAALARWWSALKS